MIEKIGHIKNPLTVIAIFAAIAEISGTTVLPFIEPANQSIYVWFLMLFPVFLVGLFFFTLNTNPSVLYAPSDYKDESNFVSLRNPTDINTLNDFTSQLENQLESSKSKIVMLEKSGETKEEEFKKAQNAYNHLMVNYGKLKTASSQHIKPDYNTVFSSVSSSSALAESTATQSPVTKNKLLDLLDMVESNPHDNAGKEIYRNRLVDLLNSDNKK